MAEVVAFRRSCREEAHEIAAAFQEVERALQKETSARVKIGFRLLTLRRRIEDGEDGPNVEWWSWIKGRVGRTKRDMEKCMALAQAEEPEEAAEQERAKTRASVRKLRKRQASYSKPRSQVVPLKIPQPNLDIVQQARDAVRPFVEQMTTEQRRQFVAHIKEDYQC